MRTGIRFDLRTPLPHQHASLYAAALEMTAFADRHNFDFVQVSEHHFAEDGYCPAPLVLASALAGATSRIRVRIGALVAPLHHPLRIAEDIAVLDVLSAGRSEVVLGAGYRPAEFAMFGVPYDTRGSHLELTVGVLREAWTGERFQFEGRDSLVRPIPLQNPFPLTLGGSSPGAARRAARLGLAFLPTNFHELFPVYLAECDRLGVDPRPRSLPGPHFLAVSNDPERSWSEMGKYLCFDSDSYGHWLAEAGMADPRYVIGAQIETLRAAGRYVICTPEACVELATSLGPDGLISVHPLIGGMPPEIAWPSLELFADQVAPRLKALWPG